MRIDATEKEDVAPRFTVSEYGQGGNRVAVLRRITGLTADTLVSPAAVK